MNFPVFDIVLFVEDLISYVAMRNYVDWDSHLQLGGWRFMMNTMFTDDIGQVVAHESFVEPIRQEVKSYGFCIHQYLVVGEIIGSEYIRNIGNKVLDENNKGLQSSGILHLCAFFGQVCVILIQEQRWKKLSTTVAALVWILLGRRLCLTDEGWQSIAVEAFYFMEQIRLAERDD